MELYLIRHTTPDIEKGVCYGQSDIGLKNTFNDEAEEISTKHPYLKSLDATIYSSPLSRCTLLAEKLFDAPISIDHRLKELDFGDWELIQWNDIRKDELTPWMYDFVNTKAKNGESYIDLNNRVLEFIKEIDTDKNVVLVAHAGVIRTLLSYINNVALKDSFEFKIGYGQVLKLATNAFSKKSI
jgi:alpha-ribazole phosphatase